MSKWWWSMWNHKEILTHFSYLRLIHELPHQMDSHLHVWWQAAFSSSLEDSLPTLSVQSYYQDVMYLLFSQICWNFSLQKWTQNIASLTCKTFLSLSDDALLKKNLLIWSDLIKSGVP